MSTDYRVQNPDDTEGEWVATRWGKRGTEKNVALDFGSNPSRVMDLRERIGDSTTVVGDDGSRFSGGDFWRFADENEWTHGEFGGTAALGDGKASEFEGLSPDQFKDII